jgi:mycothiol synthase
LWEDGDGLAGFAMLEEPDGVLLQVRPGLSGRGSLEGEMLQWAARQTRVVWGEGAGDELWIRAVEDPRLDALLRDLGFEREPDHALKMARGLDGTLPEVELLGGWTVREVGGEDELFDRVEVHREVWHPSRVTFGAYRRLRAAPGYDPRLDLVAVAPDGTFGAYCICWLDAESRTGLFEPVGTRPAYRGRGLARAVVSEGLRRLRALGAESAFVTAINGNEASAGLYASTGFDVVNTEHLYWKKL